MIHEPYADFRRQNASLSDRPVSRCPDWNCSDTPDDGQLVEVYAEDRRGFYLVPFPVRFLGDEWLNASTGQHLETFIAGWRPWQGRA